MKYIIGLTLFIGLFSCESAIESTTDSFPLFNILESDETGLNFINEVTENATFNYLTYEGMYQGAGVGVGDFNNDGLEDVFFAGNSNADRLFINQGDLTFKDFTSESGIIQDDSWSTGVAVVDINNDNLLDIYVCKFLYEDAEKRKNLLYINTGDAHFVEASKQFGLLDYGYSIHASFFDYDRDGDLDVYVVNQPPTKNTIRYNLGGQRDLRFSSKLYENQGDFGFKDVTDKAGLSNFAYSLHAMAGDYNDDGWMDLYISNDFEEADFFYVNQGDGTFVDEVAEHMGHISNFSMGSDAADVNNDGLLDLMVADMTSADPYRQKTNMASMNPAKFQQMNDQFGLPQYMHNTLQLNRGKNRFSELAFLSGVAYSDWSWAPLLADFDQDGDKDLMISNGILRDVINKDVLENRSKIQAKYRDSIDNLSGSHPSIEEFLLSKMPSKALANHYFENGGALNFSETTDANLIQNKTWTQGMAYADFDNDGDLDLIYNNTHSKAQLLENRSNSEEYISFRLQSKSFKSCPIGSKIYVHHGDTVQLQSLNPVRGYQSSCTCQAVFGVPGRSKIDSLVIIWPDGMRTRINKLTTSKAYNIKQSKRGQPLPMSEDKPSYTLELLNNHGKQRGFDDYKDERLLPYKLSEWGRKVSKNKAGNLVFIPGTEGYKSTVWKWENDAFVDLEISAFDAHVACEDVQGSFADIDKDGDDDLLVVSGAYECGLEADCALARWYENIGDNWVLRNDFPAISNHASGIISADFNGDGFMDFLISSRSIPGAYGIKPEHYLLINQAGNGFVLHREELLSEIGMITDMEIADLDNDGVQELVISEEWGSVAILKIVKNGLERVDDMDEIGRLKGLWNSIHIDDFDGDGDLDIIAGNIGLNTKYKASIDAPMNLYAGDLDKNGSSDIYLSYNHNGRELPVRGRQCSSEELPRIKQSFQTYASFANAELSEIIKTDHSDKKTINTLESVVLWNESGGFRPKGLAKSFQYSMMRAISRFDDGFLVAGNMEHWEAESSQTDALVPILVKHVTEHENSSSELSKFYDLEGEITDILFLSKGVIIILRNGLPDVLIRELS